MEIKLSIVIPCYQSGEKLREVVDSVYEVLKEIYSTEEWELILIDDGSMDSTWELLLDLKKPHKNIIVAAHKKNYGESIAVMSGLRLSRGNFALTLDDDLRHPPEKIPEMLEAIQSGFDVVYGRYEDPHYSWFRKALSWVNNVFANLILGKPPHINISGFKIYRKKFIEKISNYQCQFLQIDALIYALTDRVGDLLIEVNPDRSRYNFSRLKNQFINMISSSKLMRTSLGMYGLFLLFFICLLLLIFSCFSESTPLFRGPIVFFGVYFCFILIQMYLRARQIRLNEPVDYFREIKNEREGIYE